MKKCIVLLMIFSSTVAAGAEQNNLMETIVEQLVHKQQLATLFLSELTRLHTHATARATTNAQLVQELRTSTFRWLQQGGAIQIQSFDTACTQLYESYALYVKRCNPPQTSQTLCTKLDRSSTALCATLTRLLQYLIKDTPITSPEITPVKNILELQQEQLHLSAITSDTEYLQEYTQCVNPVTNNFPLT